MCETLVTQKLPRNGGIVECFGHKTFCCVIDMDDEPGWHKVKFTMEVSSYELKQEIPEDLEETILDSYKVWECWEVFEDIGHIVGVTKWRECKT